MLTDNILMYQTSAVTPFCAMSATVSELATLIVAGDQKLAPGKFGRIRIASVGELEYMLSLIHAYDKAKRRQISHLGFSVTKEDPSVANRYSTVKVSTTIDFIRDGVFDIPVVLRQLYGASVQLLGTDAGGGVSGLIHLYNQES